MEKWEYKYVHSYVRIRKENQVLVSTLSPDEAQLNALGADGWELAGVINDTGGGILKISTSVTLIFKRRKQ